jgi:hypothetical protein
MNYVGRNLRRIHSRHQRAYARLLSEAEKRRRSEGQFVWWKAMDLPQYWVQEETPVTVTDPHSEIEGRKKDIRSWPEGANMEVSCNPS